MQHDANRPAQRTGWLFLSGRNLIVMGSHGQGMLEQVVIGSTSRRVLRRCKKPVLIVRLPENGEAQT
jgi:hypothetical protein